MQSASPPPVNKTKLLAGQVLGGAAGIAAGNYSGMNLLIPGVALVAIFYLGNKLLRPVEPKYLSAAAIQGAHLAWLVAGMALLGSWGANLIDVAILGIGVIWLWRAPSIWPVVLLTTFQVFALAVNTNLILQYPIGAPDHRSLAVHIGLRIGAIVAMWWAWFVTRKPSEA
jgi:hypothetical protein